MDNTLVLQNYCGNVFFIINILFDYYYYYYF